MRGDGWKMEKVGWKIIRGWIGNGKRWIGNERAG